LENNQSNDLPEAFDVETKHGDGVRTDQRKGWSKVLLEVEAQEKVAVFVEDWMN